MPHLESSPQFVIHGFIDRDVKMLKFVGTVSWSGNLDDVMLFQCCSELMQMLFAHENSQKSQEQGVFCQAVR